MAISPAISRPFQVGLLPLGTIPFAFRSHFPFGPFAGSVLGEMQPGLHCVVQYPDDLDDLVPCQPIEDDMAWALDHAICSGSSFSGVDQVKAS